MDTRSAEALEVIRKAVGGCREDLGAAGNHEQCWAPAEFVLWGKLLPPEALGPRCYDHAAAHVGHRALAPGSGWALINLCALAKELER